MLFYRKSSLSYERLGNKILREAPEANIGNKARTKRELEQHWTTDRSLNSGEPEFVKDEVDKKIESNDLYF